MNSPKPTKLEEILKKTERTGGARFTQDEIRLLSLHYSMVLKWNKRLHLTTIVEPQEFVDRHILESDFADYHLLKNIDQVWDLGSGLGIPGIPLTIFRPTITVHLVDSDRSKAIFLEEAAIASRLSNAKVVCARIESLAELPQGACLTARAVEKMERIIPEILRVGAKCSQILIFGSNRTEHLISQQLTKHRVFRSHLIPKSKQRRLFDIVRST